MYKEVEVFVAALNFWLQHGSIVGFPQMRAFNDALEALDWWFDATNGRFVVGSSHTLGKTPKRKALRETSESDFWLKAHASQARSFGRR